MVMPYLRFTGNCEEAFLLYQRAFGGQAPVFARYREAPPAFYPNLTDEQKNQIMHGHIMLTETGGVSGADAIDSVEMGSAISIHVFCATPEQAETAFSVLAEEGIVISPLQPNSPPHDSGISGAVTDPYGFSWVLSAQLQE